MNIQGQKDDSQKFAFAGWNSVPTELLTPQEKSGLGPGTFGAALTSRGLKRLTKI